MPVPSLDQRNYIIGTPDNANVDSCSYDSENTERTGQSKGVNFIVRIQVAEDVGNSTGNDYWQLFVNSVNDRPTAWQITTTSSDVQSVSDTPSTNPATYKCTNLDPPLTWQNGLLVESSDESGKLQLAGNYFTEFAWICVFTSGASDNTSYYFWLYFSDDPLTGTYDNIARVKTAVPSEAYSGRGVGRGIGRGVMR